MEAGAAFSKSWTFRNCGETAWPMDVHFIRTSGDDMGASEQQLTQRVAPEDEYVWTVSMVAPAKPGRYTAFFRMQTGHHVRFGHKVWADVKVVEAKPVAAQEQAPLQMPRLVAQEPLAEPAGEPEAAQAPAQSAFEEGGDVEMGKSFYPELPNDDELYDKECEGVLEASQALKNMLTPQQVYFEAVGKLEDAKLRTDLTTLYNFGFVDFEQNKAMMLTHKNVEVVASTLCEGLLTKSYV